MNNANKTPIYDAEEILINNAEETPNNADETPIIDAKDTETATEKSEETRITYTQWKLSTGSAEAV